jgi:hypothetical protein
MSPVYVPVVAGLLIAVFAGTGAELSVLVPPVVLLTMAGLALLPALIVALREITAGPLVLGPVCAFAIALSTCPSSASAHPSGRSSWATISAAFEREGWKPLVQA